MTPDSQAIVLDTTELRRDWLLRGFRFQLLALRSLGPNLRVYVPAVSFEELIAHRGRELEERLAQLRKSSELLSRLGHEHSIGSVGVPMDYRAYLEERMDEVLGFEVLEWPVDSHERLVDRAVSRRQPFDANGGGYRDSLVWASVLELARKGADVVLVSADKRAFSDGKGNLSPELLSELDDMTGTVRLVDDIVPLLLESLPDGENIVEAVMREHDEELIQWYLASDVQDDLTPDAQDLGFSDRPLKFEATESTWNGGFNRLSAITAGDASILAEYRVDQRISFSAILPEGSMVDQDWQVVEADLSGRLHIEGEVDMVILLGVLFDSEMSFSIEALEWRRADGTSRGLGVGPTDPTSIALFDP